MSSLKGSPFELVLTDTAKRFGKKTLWSDLSFTAQSATITGVTGASGSGKTTLLNCIGRLEELDAGTVTFGNWSFGPDAATRTGSQRNRRACFREVLGFLFQNYGLVESWNVKKNLMVPLRNRRGGRSLMSSAIEEALARVGMGGAEREKIYTLSGGEQQRVALARLILKEPSVVLADEPTSALDHANADLVMSILAEQADGGALVLIATHSDRITSQCSGTISLDANEADAAAVKVAVDS